MDNLTLKQQEKLKKTILDPELFIREILKSDLYKDQIDIIKAMTDPDIDTVAVRSYHSAGKTFLASRLALWFLTRYKNSRIVVLHPVYKQTTEIFFKELNDCFNRHLNFLFKNILGWGEPIVNQDKIELNKLHYIIGVSVDDTSSVNIAGHKSDKLLVIADEASALHPIVNEALDGLLSGGSIQKKLLIGNPLLLSGQFYEVFTFKPPRTMRIHMSPFTNPNFKEFGLHDLDSVIKLSDERLEEIQENLPAPYLMSPQILKKRYEEYNVNSFKSRLLGEFPDQADNVMFSHSDIEGAIKRDIEDEPWKMTQVGIDVARSGTDRTTIFIARGYKVLDIRLMANKTITEIANWVARKIKEGFVKAENVHIDEAGIGIGIGDILEEDGIYINGVNGAKTAENFPEEYINQRAEDYDNCRRLFQGKVVDLPAKNPYIRELSEELSVITSKIGSRGKLQVESKDEFKKKLNRSPDFADGLILALRATPPPESQVSFG